MSGIPPGIPPACGLAGIAIVPAGPAGWGETRRSEVEGPAGPATSAAARPGRDCVIDGSSTVGLQVAGRRLEAAEGFVRRILEDAP